MNFADVLRNKTDFIGSNGRSKANILKAENELCVQFASDYFEYLEKIGLASIGNHELTGLTKDTRLDVVAVTKECRSIYGPATKLWYVIENPGIDGIVIWQDSDSVIYKSSFLTIPTKIADSLTEYLAE